MVVCPIVPDGVDDAVCRSASFKSVLSSADFTIVVGQGREASSSRHWARLELGVVVVG